MAAAKPCTPTSWRRRPASFFSARRRPACAKAWSIALPASETFTSWRRTRRRGSQEHSLDLIVLHSVVQYLTVSGASALFALFHRLLKPGGMLVVSDVIPPNVPAVTDAFALLRFGAGNGFFFAAAWGLVRTLLSNYWKLRSKLGLTRYANAAMIEKLDAAGFDAALAPANIGHNRARKAFYAQRR